MLQSDARKYSYSSAPLYGLEGRKLTFGPINHFGLHPCIDQNCDNGYVWNTTGSGKTLTSFKASTLLKSNESIHKCLFVVDRKDLDRQTREEFNRFQENCVEENTNTASLVRRLLSDDYADKVIVTTIQKLGLALDENNKRNTARGRSTFKQRLDELRDRRMVFIFDECHRSQFGENHRAIKEFFPNSQLFGFTGTPIFEKNATVRRIEGDAATLGTTRFAVLFQRWVVERTFAWMGRCRRLAKDFERTVASSLAWARLAACR